ncbi:MAG: hypothetical protein KF790_04740 [Steroidobacteraceae bacterium]|nr:hypothetical protein [Steroidobacteraceae bacterium]
MPALVAAPAWRTTRWFNVPARLALADLRGRVVCVCAFQAEIMALIGERVQVVPAGEAVPAGVCTPGGCT